MASKIEIHIDDFHPQNSGFSQTYKGTWREQGMIATAWLEPAEPGRFPRGVYLRDTYELSSTYESSRPGAALGSLQEERGADLARKLRERMQEEMLSADWEVVAQSSAGLNLWQYRPARPSSQQREQQPAPAIRKPGGELVAPSLPARRLVISGKKVKSHSRTITQQAITFTCARCGQSTTRAVYPGATPQYCEPCAKEVEREKTRARVARLRAAKRKMSANNV